LHVTKPIKQSDLLDAIVTVIGERIALTARTRKPAKVEAARRRLHILVAEDNAVNRALAVRTLEKRGHRVETAPNGRVAIEKVSGADNPSTSC
jgi:PleD family two-component response regulator